MKLKFTCRYVVWIGVAFVCCFIYYELNNTQWTWYLHNNFDRKLCVLPEAKMRDMVELTSTAHEILTLFKLTHMPFYGR